MLAIQNFGMLWERQRVDFGRQKVAGKLLGSNSLRKDQLVDFRQQSGIYTLYDETKKIVYVGQTGSGNQKLLKRLRDHRDDHLWNRWSYFSWFGFCKVNKNGALSLADRPERRLKGSVADALDEIEAVLLQLLEPVLNKQGPKWRGAEQFFQEWEEHMESPTVEHVAQAIDELARGQEVILKALSRIQAGLE